MNKDVLLDGIERTAHDLAKFTKHYEKFMMQPGGPNDLWKANKYLELQSIQRGLLKQLNEN